jgi:hypothetical protein
MAINPIDLAVKFSVDSKLSGLVLPGPDRVRDDGSGIPNALGLLDSGFRRNDTTIANATCFDSIFPSAPKKKDGPLRYACLTCR